MWFAILTLLALFGSTVHANRFNADLGTIKSSSDSGSQGLLAQPTAAAAVGPQSTAAAVGPQSTAAAAVTVARRTDPDTQVNNAFSISSSEGCQLNGAVCVTSVNFPSDYANSKACTITVRTAGHLLACEFNTEDLNDVLTVVSDNYSGNVGPEGIEVPVGAQLLWSADDSVAKSGWRICLSNGELDLISTGGPTYGPSGTPTSGPPTHCFDRPSSEASCGRWHDTDGPGYHCEWYGSACAATFVAATFSAFSTSAPGGDPCCEVYV